MNRWSQLTLTRRARARGCAAIVTRASTLHVSSTTTGDICGSRTRQQQQCLQGITSLVRARLAAHLQHRVIAPPRNVGDHTPVSIFSAINQQPISIAKLQPEPAVLASHRFDYAGQVWTGNNTLSRSGR